MAEDAVPVLTHSAIRAVAYVRVSQAREGMISPQLQLQAVEDYCRRRGYELTHTLEDLDVSGRFWERRQVERAISMIEHGEADVIVVWRWSRVTRARLDWAVAVDRVEAAGGRLESATEAFDTSTSVGRLARGILAEIAAFESDRMGDGWREVRDRRVHLGLPSHGHAQFGYRKQQGRYVRDRRSGPVLGELYLRYNAGASFHSLVKWLNDQGLRTAAPKRPGTGWSLASLQRAMDSGFAAGYVRDYDRLVSGAQKPVISEEVWQAYQARRGATSWRRPTSFQDFLLIDLVWCGCGSRMSPVRESGTNSRYRCLRHPDRRSGLTILRHRLDGLVYQWVVALVTSPDVRDVALAAAQAHSVRLSAEAAELRQKLATVDGQAHDDLIAALEQARSDAARSTPTAVAQALLEDWDVLSLLERRRRLTALTSRIMVHNDLPNPLIEVHTTWGSVMAYTGRGHHSRIDTAPLSTEADTTVESPANISIDPLQLLTPAEAGRIVGIQPQSLRDWDRLGRLPHTQWAPDGRGRLYAIQDLRKLRPRRRPGPEAASRT